MKITTARALTRLCHIVEIFFLKKKGNLGKGLHEGNKDMTSSCWAIIPHHLKKKSEIFLPLLSVEEAAESYSFFAGKGPAWFFLTNNGMGFKVKKAKESGSLSLSLRLLPPHQLEGCYSDVDELEMLRMFCHSPPPIVVAVLPQYVDPAPSCVEVRTAQST